MNLEETAVSICLKLAAPILKRLVQHVGRALIYVGKIMAKGDAKTPRKKRISKNISRVDTIHPKRFAEIPASKGAPSTAHSEVEIKG